MTAGTAPTNESAAMERTLGARDVPLLAGIDLELVADVYEEWTCTTAPVSSVAGFVTFETVSPRTPGSVAVTVSSTDPGSCMPEGLPPTTSICTLDDGCMYGRASSSSACGSENCS